MGLLLGALMTEGKAKTADIAPLGRHTSNGNITSTLAMPTRTSVPSIPFSTMPSPRQRRLRSRQEEERPPGHYISGAVIALSVISLLGAIVAPFLGALGLPFAVSGVVSAVGFAAVWAVLKNLRELNGALNDEYGDSESG